MVSSFQLLTRPQQAATDLVKKLQSRDREAAWPGLGKSDRPGGEAAVKGQGGSLVTPPLVSSGAPPSREKSTPGSRAPPCRE